ncbi:MAG: nucleotidyltransferase family protein [Candidatus Binatia bacterium]|nr:nucleotidyltransferase family protein [Candidatus Binatia bacterium]
MAARREDIAGIILAGGGSTRMGHPKATLRWDGVTFIESELRALQSAGLAPLVVVCGIHADETRSALPTGLEVEVHENPDPDRGQLSSLKIALRALAPHDTRTAALVTLVDHPAVKLATLEALCDAALPDRIVVPRFEGRRGHPVVFGREIFDELLATPDESGARPVVRADPNRVVEVETDDAGVLVDIDTPEDLARARQREPRR